MLEKITAYLGIEDPNFTVQLEKYLPTIYRRGRLDTFYGMVLPIEVSDDDEDEVEQDAISQSIHCLWGTFKVDRMLQCLHHSWDRQTERELAQQPKDWIRMNELKHMLQIKARGVGRFIVAFFALKESNMVVPQDMKPNGYEAFRLLGLNHEVAKRYAEFSREREKEIKEDYHSTGHWASDWLRWKLYETPMREVLRQIRFCEEEPSLENEETN